MPGESRTLVKTGIFEPRKTVVSQVKELAFIHSNFYRLISDQFKRDTVPYCPPPSSLHTAPGLVQSLFAKLGLDEG